MPYLSIRAGTGYVTDFFCPSRLRSMAIPLSSRRSCDTPPAASVGVFMYYQYVALCAPTYGNVHTGRGSFYRCPPASTWGYRYEQCIRKSRFYVCRSHSRLGMLC
jgi:hypothetical protein